MRLVRVAFATIVGVITIIAALIPASLLLSLKESSFAAWRNVFIVSLVISSILSVIGWMIIYRLTKSKLSAWIIVGLTFFFGGILQAIWGWPF